MNFSSVFCIQKLKYLFGYVEDFKLSFIVVRRRGGGGVGVFLGVFILKYAVEQLFFYLEEVVQFLVWELSFFKFCLEL